MRSPSTVPMKKKVEKKLSARGIGRMFDEGWLARLHKVGQNEQKSDEILAAHLTAVRGRVHTRFPPEPNGFLHIGHSKAIVVNFGYAQYHGGVCYLRYDDTNPEAEDEIYSRSILEMVEWLGFKPWEITYSSDYFDRLYGLAEELIRRGKGYVCHCTPEEIHQHRGGENKGSRSPCAHRSRPTEESLTQFRAMRDGKYQPGQATLRMKQNLEDGNPQMWDLIAFRILSKPHHRTGNRWIIYPTYDFTHCLVDSFENITHSLCTTEFELSRASYEWLCDVLDVYKPQQREYGRLNITNTVLSKRKILKLVNDGHVHGWDDPRLYTLVALRRRGVPPGAILTFVSELGVTSNVTNIEVARFESTLRSYLDKIVPRLMLVLDPIPVVIENLEEDDIGPVTIPYMMADESMGKRVVQFSKLIYIDRTDFRAKGEETCSFFRLTIDNPVGLMKLPHPIRLIGIESDPSSGRATVLRAEYLKKDPPVKPKAYIQWVPESHVRVHQVRLYNPLFRSTNPSGHAEGFTADIDPTSEQIIKTAIIEPAFDEVRAKSPFIEPAGGVVEAKAPEVNRFQAMRIGYFCEDKDSTEDRVILNRIVTLKEDSAKNR